MNELLDELKQIIVEYGFTSRFALIEQWHAVGKVINSSTAKDTDIPEIAEALNKDEEDIWNAILFFKRYPDLSLFPSGKNISWETICDNLE